MTTENAATIRPRTPADTPACVQALAEVHHRDGYPVNWPADPGDWLCAASGLGAWTAELDGHLVGHVALTPSGEGDAAPALWGDPRATAVVSRLFVTPRARGHGIGALLLDRAAAEAHHHGLHPVLDVVTSDTAAAALYERLGWQHLATVEQHWSPAQTVTVHCYAGPGAR